MKNYLIYLLCLSCGLFAHDFDIVVNEIHYNPAGADDASEFLELFNAGPTHVDLSGWTIEAAVDYAFPDGTILAPMGFAVVAADPALIQARYGVDPVYGPWTGSLANDGERIMVKRADGMIMDFVRYDDTRMWAKYPDRKGPTLELADPYSNNEFGRFWRSSAWVGGTPGARNSTGAVEDFQVCINEIKLSGGATWVELYNRSFDPIALGGYYFMSGHDPSDLIPLPEVTLTRFATFDLSFSVSDDNDCYYLVAPDGATIVDIFEARRNLLFQSTGYFPDGSGMVHGFTASSKGLPNMSPVTDAIYISEIMYHPAPAGVPLAEPLELEYVGIANRGSAPVDLTGWSFTKGISFDFQQGIALGPGQELLVARNVDALTAAYGGLGDTLVVGPFTGKLVNAMEKLYLRDNVGNLVDSVAYADDGAWPPEADGAGAALCLKTSLAGVDNDCGDVWEAVFGGTPGDVPPAVPIAPVVRAVTHDPPVPTPSDPVTVTCRVMDSDAVSSVALGYRVNDGDESSVAMADDGVAPDREAGDGLWTARIGPFADETLVSFHIYADDGDTPDASTDAPGAGRDFLFVVDQGMGPDNSHRPYRIIMTEANWDELTSRSEESDVLLDATFIGDGGGIFYNVGVRYRGGSSRYSNPKSYRVNFHDAQRFNGIRKLNLNRHHPDDQVVSMDLMRRAGLPYCQEWMVNLWIHGDWDDSYLRIEAVDEEYLTRLLGDNHDEGILYRGLEIDDADETGDLSYWGTDPESYRPFYERINGDWGNDDYAQLIELCRRFSSDEVSDEDFPAAIAEVVDTEQWIHFFAANACLNNREGGIANDKGEDYFIYFRQDDGRAMLLPWDLDTSFDSADEVLFRPTVDAIARLLRHPAFSRRYYYYLNKLRVGAFSRREMRQSMALVGEFADFDERDEFETYMADRLGYLYEHIPTAITGGIQAVGTPAFVRVGDLWRYFKGTEDPSGGSLAWTALDFDDSEWLEGPSGFGYGDGDDRTPLEDMEDNYATVFIRRKFSVDDPGEVGSLILSIDYDDGFVAYLNGVRVAEDNAPGGDPDYDWRADDDHEAGEAVDFDLGDDIDLLQAGENVLAIIGMNVSRGSSDFSLIPALKLGGEAGAGGGSGDLCFVTSPMVTLGGKAPADKTHRVTVNGAEAFYDPLWADWYGTAMLAPGENQVTVQAFDGADAMVEEKVFRIHRVDGFTPLGGEVTENTVLTAAQSPYVLADDLTVAHDAKLTIQPGVVVLADGGASIDVDGHLEALGTEHSPIFFNSLSMDNPWNGIKLNETGVSDTAPLHQLRYCHFRTGEDGSGHDGFVEPIDARILIEHCTFEGIRGNGLDGTDARVTIRHCLFRDLYESVHCNTSQVTIYGCTLDGMIGDNDFIDFDGPSMGPCVIESCILRNTMDDGIDFGSGASADILNNIISNCGDKAFSVEDGQGSRLIGNVFTGNCTAVALKSGSQLAAGDAHHNTIVGNIEGVMVYAKEPGDDGSDAAMHSSIIMHNKRDIFVDAESRLDLSHSDVWLDIFSHGIWPGTGNISADPLFADAMQLDFRLAAGSPCIGTGADGTDMGALPFGGTPAGEFLRGDVNDDREIDLSDAVSVLLYLFGDASPPSCLDAADANDSGSLNLGDAIYLLSYLFGDGPNPPAPFPARGMDPTADDLVCQ